jgi:transposase
VGRLLTDSSPRQCAGTFFASSVAVFRRKRHPPPYSPDLAPADLWLFPKLKSVLKGKCFSNAKDIKSSVKNILTNIPV